MTRLIYSLDSARAARVAIVKLQQLGFEQESVALAARSDIELERLPNDYAAETSDFNDGLKRGLALGGSTGLVAGLIAASIPTLGLTLGGAALLALAGAAVGGWSAALVGTSIPSDIRRDFEQEIERGRVILAIKIAPGDEAKVERAMATLGAGAKPVRLSHGPMAA